MNKIVNCSHKSKSTSKQDLSGFEVVDPQRKRGIPKKVSQKEIKRTLRKRKSVKKSVDEEEVR